MKTSPAYLLGVCLLLLFSAVLALGQFNPFSSVVLTYEDSAEGSMLTRVVEVLFIGYLAVFCSHRRGVGRAVTLPLCLFTLLYAATTTLNAVGLVEGWRGVLVLVAKLVLVVVLCLRLPAFLRPHPRLLHLSLLCYALVMCLIGAGYMAGLLERWADFHGGRLWLFGENCNATSLRLGLAMLIAVHHVFVNPLRLGFWRWALLPALVPVLYTIMASGSRGSFLIPFLCLALYAFFFPTRPAIKFSFLIVALALTSVVVVDMAQENADWELFDRLTETAETGDDAGRALLNAYTLDIFEDFPLFGAGSVRFAHEMLTRFYETRPCHNLFVSLFALTGMAGATLFFIFFLALGRRAWRMRRYDPFPLTLFLFVVLLGSKMGGVLAYIVMWHVMGVTLTLTEQNTSHR